MGRIIDGLLLGNLGYADLEWSSVVAASSDALAQEPHAQ